MAPKRANPVYASHEVQSGLFRLFLWAKHCLSYKQQHLPQKPETSHSIFPPKQVASDCYNDPVVTAFTSKVKKQTSNELNSLSTTIGSAVMHI